MTRAACTVVGGGRLEWQAGVVIHSQRSAHGIHPSLPAFAFIHQDRNCSQALFFSDGKREKKCYKSNTQYNTIRQNTIKTHQVGRSKLLCRQTREEDQLQVTQYNTIQYKLSRQTREEDLQVTQCNTNSPRPSLATKRSTYKAPNTIQTFAQSYRVYRSAQRIIQAHFFIAHTHSSSTGLSSRFAPIHQDPFHGRISFVLFVTSLLYVVNVNRSINSLSKYLQKTLCTRNA